jgi:hypothetical protein
MIEGWSGDDYLVLFSDDEAESESGRYGIRALLPGYRLVGLHSWDDFIVQDESGTTFSVPAVACESTELVPFKIPCSGTLVADERFAGKVKWHITPVKFGGSPSAEENITWIPLPQHADAVRWWNALYRDMKVNGRLTLNKAS